MKTLQDYIDKLNALNFKDMYNSPYTQAVPVVFLVILKVYLQYKVGSAA